MAKPTGARCNLRCDYCFFLEKEQLYPGSDFRMSDEVMEAFISQTARAQQVPQVTLAWQGGEPTLMGLDFFRRARAAEGGRVPAGMAVERTIQTNGVLLDDERCACRAANDYRVGLSLDGRGRDFALCQLRSLAAHGGYPVRPGYRARRRVVLPGA